MKRLLTTVIAFVLMLAMLTACAAADFASEPVAEAPVAPALAPEPAPAPAPAPAADPAPAPAAAPEAPAHAAPHPDPGPYFALPTLDPFERDRALVYTVNMQLQTTHILPGTRFILNTVGNLGGYVTFFEFNGHDMRSPHVERHGIFTFSIPTIRLNDFIVYMENNYNILWLRQTTDDITAEYRQVATTLEDMQHLEQLLLQDIENTEDEAVRRDLEAQLRQLRVNIRNMQTAHADIVETVVYSTLHITLFEVILPDDDYVPEPEAEPPTFGERFSETVSNSLSVLGSFAQGLLLFLITIAPVLLILAIIGVATLLITKAVRKRKKMSANNTSSEKSNSEITQNTENNDNSEN